MTGEEKPSPTVSVVFSGLLGEVLRLEFPDGKQFEKFRRPPGTRLIIVSPEGKILVTKERRYETGGVDIRIPGGKVCDSVEDYHALLDSGRDIQEAVIEAGAKEGLEETGLELGTPQVLAIANAGATVEWDLWYLLYREYTVSANGQQLEAGEDIEVDWMDPGELRAVISDGQMQEWRTVGILLGRALPMLEDELAGSS